VAQMMGAIKGPLTVGAKGFKTDESVWLSHPHLLKLHMMDRRHPHQRCYAMHHLPQGTKASDRHHLKQLHDS
jgi:hypothetical protein